MKKNQIFIIVVVVAIIGVGAYILLNGGKINLAGKSINVGEITSMETFSGSLKMAVEKGIPLKCSAPKDETTGIEVVTGYLKGKKYYAEVNQRDKPGYIIMVDNCMWSWQKGAKQGAKMCFEGDLWEQQSSSNNNYQCKTAVFSDSLFTPPSDVDFVDVDKIGGGIEE